MKKYLLPLFIALAACDMNKEEADLIVLNANIYTVDKDFSKAGAFVVRDGKFLAVGTARSILEQYTSAQTVDAEGQTIIPGLYDAHCHFYGLGISEQQVDLVGTTSFEEVLARVKEFHEANPGNAILGRGWDQNDWAVKEFPERMALDTAYPDIPVALRRIDGHALLVNQKALEMAGIDGSTVMSGGEVIKKNGVPTGVLVDSPMSLVDAVMPDPDLQTRIRALKDAERICFDHGLTTVNDAGLNRREIELIDSLQQAGELSIRIYAMVSNRPENVDYYLDRGILKTDRLHVRSVKVYADGALGSRGAALKAPYTDHAGHFGAMITNAAQLEALASRIARSDYQMNTHAIGDSANIAVLRAYRQALDGQQDRRWKVEHAQIMDPADYHYFETGIIPSVQPTHATSDMYWAEDRLGEDRMPGAYAFKSLLNHAGYLALGTDFPVEKVNPYHTFYAAVARRDLEGYPANGFQLKDALSREEALRGMTIWAAYSNFEESERGSIEVGKLADFVILDRDIMRVAEEEIPKIKARHVYIAGRIAE